MQVADKFFPRLLTEEKRNLSISLLDNSNIVKNFMKKMKILNFYLNP